MASGKPKSRNDEIVVQEINGEVLIYDLRDNRAVCLNETSALVWRACDGTNTVDDIGRMVGNDDVVWLALEQLKNERLIDSAPIVSSKFDGMGRREVIKKIGLGAMVALPVVAALVAPTGAYAQSSCTPGPVGQPNGSACTRSCQCSSGCCKSNGGPAANFCVATGPGNSCFPA
jgi:hypothetical protein